jgi:hypothetical protein
MGKKTAIFTFTCLTQTVSTGVPEDLTGLGVAERNKKNLAVLLQRTIQVPQLLIVNFGYDNIGSDILGNIAQERTRSGLEGFGRDRREVAVANVKGNGDFGVRAVLGLFEILLPEFLEELVSLNHEFWENIGSRGLLFRIFWRGSGFRGLRVGGRPHRNILGGFGGHFEKPLRSVTG